MVQAISPFDGFGRMTPPRNYEPPPPPWPAGDDPRTDECRHDWPSPWGERGERQHQCNGCQRWIWERSIWPPEAPRDGRSPSDDCVLENGCTTTDNCVEFGTCVMRPRPPDSGSSTSGDAGAERPTR